jgi:hypothetical protein
MSQHPSRDDLCYCNSGKKFKNCHMRQLKPTEYLTVNVTKYIKSVEYFATKNDGRTESINGILDILVYLQHDYSWDKELDGLVEPLLNIRIRDNQFKTEIFKSKLGKLKHKLNAVNYYSFIFKEKEEKIIKEFSVEYTAENVSYSMDEPILILSTESFLFQCKSCLDVLAQMIGLLFTLDLNTWGNEGDEIIKQIRIRVESGNVKGNKNNYDELNKIIEKNKYWIKDLVDMRDDVTHFSDLEGMSCFIYESVDERAAKAKIFYPSLPDGQRVSKYMEGIKKNLQDLIKEISILANSLNQSN